MDWLQDVGREITLNGSFLIARGAGIVKDCPLAGCTHPAQCLKAAVHDSATQSPADASGNSEIVEKPSCRDIEPIDGLI